MSVKIVTDSTCDLPGSIVDEQDITVVPCYINIGDQSFLDGVELSRREFYQRLPGSSSLPTTSAPGIETFVNAYQQLATEGTSGIISIHVPGSLSNIFNMAQLAAERVDSVPVTVVDSGQLSLGTGLLALAAARAASGGCSRAEILALLQEKASRVYSFAALDTVEYLHRSGRVSRLQSELAALLRIKPLIKMHSGELTLERVRTTKNALERLIRLVSDLGPLEQLAIVHTHAPDRAKDLQRQAQHLFPAGEVPLFAEVTPVIGAHVGPGAVGMVVSCKG
jgi:DegV family protein with EDD domain